MAKVYMAPQVTPYGVSPRLFLAGSINMGTATNWQDKVIDSLKHVEVDIYNPRRDDWDSSWVQSIDNPQFNEQVNWELDHIDAADVICFVFDKEGPSPITLMELGYAAPMSTHIIVCCPQGYWRKGNVDIMCARNNIKVVETLEETIDWLIEQLN